MSSSDNLCEVLVCQSEEGGDHKVVVQGASRVAQAGKQQEQSEVKIDLCVCVCGRKVGEEGIRGGGGRAEGS